MIKNIHRISIHKRIKELQKEQEYLEDAMEYTGPVCSIIRAHNNYENRINRLKRLFYKS